MKKVFSMLVMVLFVSSTVINAQSSKASVSSEPIAGFKQLNPPPKVKSSKKFDVNSKELKKKIFTINKVNCIVYFDMNGKVSYIGYQGNNPVNTNGLWEYLGCIYDATDDRSTAACMKNHYPQYYTE